MSDLSVTVVSEADRAERTVTTGTKAWELFVDGPDKDRVIAARIDGDLRDLSHELTEGSVVEGVAIDSPDGRDILRHSTAHVMAQAVQELFPDAKLGIGPPITDGFYYDFDVAEPFHPEDLDEDRDPDAQDRQGGAAVQPPPGLRRRRAHRARRRALQARADRAEGVWGGRGLDRRSGRRCERRGGRRRAHDLRQPQARRRRWPGRTSAVVRTCRRPSGSRRSS